eukprot:1093167-Rhodomonas_salina.1
MLLSAYAIPCTAIAHAAICVRVAISRRACSGKSGTDQAYGVIGLCARYGKSGTDSAELTAAFEQAVGLAPGGSEIKCNHLPAQYNLYQESGGFDLISRCLRFSELTSRRIACVLRGRVWRAHMVIRLTAPVLTRRVVLQEPSSPLHIAHRSEFLSLSLSFGLGFRVHWSRVRVRWRVNGGGGSRVTDDSWQLTDNSRPRVHGSRFRIHAAPLTVHASRVTLDPPRVTHHAPRFTLHDRNERSFQGQ